MSTEPSAELLELRRAHAELATQHEHLNKQIEQLARRNDYFERENAALRAERQALLHRLFGRKSEKLDATQANLFAEAHKELTAEIAALSNEDSILEPARETKKRQSRKERLSTEGLPRVRRVIEVPEDERQCGCCHTTMEPFGEEVTEQLDYVPASIRVIEEVRKKYACANCHEGVITAPLPSRPLPKVMASAELLAYIATSKYSDHLPLYRLEQILERQGLRISRQTMCGWLGQTADLLEPIVGAMKRQILSEPLVQADDTPIRYQDRAQRGRMGRGYLWAYTIPWREVVFDFTIDRSRAGPSKFLAEYNGFLQADGYAGFNEVFNRGGIEHIACMAHVRRKIFESRAEHPEAAGPLLAGIQFLYRLEREAKADGVVGPALLEMRADTPTRVLAELESLLHQMVAETLPKSGFGRAVRYAVDQWPAIERYTKVAEAELDNNSCESSIRPVALGRKNWLFAGSADGGRRAAILFSLVTSCKRLKLDPYRYLADVIARTADHKLARIDELTPRRWATESA